MCSFNLAFIKTEYTNSIQHKDENFPKNSVVLNKIDLPQSFIVLNDIGLQK